MNELDPVDFSALQADPIRWKSIVTRTMEQVDVVMQARARSNSDPIEVIASWRRTLLAAAALVFAALPPVEILLEIRERRAETIHRLAMLSVVSAYTSSPPSAEAILRTLAAESSR